MPTKYSVPAANNLTKFLSKVTKSSVTPTDPRRLLNAYQAGFIGCFTSRSDQPSWATKIERYERDKFLASAPFAKFSEHAALASGKGKRAVNFNFSMRLSPRAFVFYQEYGNCTFASMSEIMTMLMGTRILGLKMEEEFVERHGSVWYSTRGHCSQGSALSQAANAVVELGMQLMIKYCDGKYDFTEENTDEYYGNNWCRSGPPKDLIEVTKKNLHKTVSYLDTVDADAVRDTLFNGGALHTGSTYTAVTSGDPISGLQSIGGHAQSCIGYDDTDEFRDWYKQKTGKTIPSTDFVCIWDQTWGPDWNKVSNWPTELWGQKPEGAWVTLFSTVQRTIFEETYAYMPDLNGFAPHPVEWKVV